MSSIVTQILGSSSYVDEVCAILLVLSIVECFTWLKYIFNNLIDLLKK